MTVASASSSQESENRKRIPGGGKTGELIRSFNWSKTTLGPISGWPQSLCTSVNILLASPVPIVMLWDTDGYMIYNDAYSVFAGKRHPTLLGSKVVEGWPEVADFNTNVMKQGLQGKTLSYKDQQLVLHRNNVAEDVWMDLNYSPILDESGKPKGVWAIVVETTKQIQAISKQQLAEDELRTERERLKSLLQQAPALIAVLRGSDYIFDMANPPYQNVVALHRDIIGKPLMEAIPELAGQGILELLNNVRKTSKAYHGIVQTRLDRNGDGKLEDGYFNLVYQPIKEEDGTFESILVHAVEITEQITAQQKAEQLSAQLQTVFDSLPDGLYIAENDTITHINQRGAEALGYASPEEVPRTLTELYETISVRYDRSGKAVTLKDSTLGNALRGKAIEHIGVRVANPITGKEQVIRTAGAPIRDKNGAVIGAVAINSDLTELYKLQEKVQKEAVTRRLLTQKTNLLKQQNDQLTKLNATKDEFIALTSHQLRTPATGVKQYVAMLMQGYAGPVTPEQEQFLERAYESNERQLHIIEDILRVAKVDMGKTQLRMEQYDIVSLLGNILDEQADRFDERHLSLVTDLPNTPVEVRVDISQLHMAIGNIIDNAIKYTADQKTITVSLSQTDKQVIICIQDQGVGIAKADIEKLFQKFSRIPNPRSISVGGTGLGLYWTKRIIELHHGSIAVESKSGKGTTFTISLPRS